MSGDWKLGREPVPGERSAKKRNELLDAAWLRARDKLSEWPTLSGTVDERYRDNRMELVGYGAFGLVFKAKRQSDGQTVAVKMVIAEPSVFLRELRALLYLRERNGCERSDLICYQGNFKAEIGQRVLDEIDRFSHGDKALRLEHFQVSLDNPKAKGVFIEMRFVQGENMLELMHRVKPNAFGFEKHARMLLSVMRALEFMHANKIVHRDLKPANIMVINADSEMIECVVVDVGEACRVEARDVEFRFGACTEYGGTHSFLSPELIALEARDVPARDIDLRLWKSFDIYAAGMTFYDWGRNDTKPGRLSEEVAIELVQGKKDWVFWPQRVPTDPFFPAELDDAEGTMNVLLQEMLNFDEEERTTAEVAAEFLEDSLKKPLK